MPYTYLITGATSDVGRTLIARLLHGAPDALVLAQGCGDLDKLAPLCQRFPGQVRPFDVDLSDRAKVDTFVQLLQTSAPPPTHFIHLPALLVGVAVLAGGGGKGVLRFRLLTVEVEAV